MLLVGLRTSLIRQPKYDLFATDDVLAEAEVEVARTVYAEGSFSVVPGLSWSYGARSADARGEPTELQTHRVAAVPELRHHVKPWLYGFLAPSLGARHLNAMLEEGSTGALLQDKDWVFNVDAMAGIAVRFFGKDPGRSLRAWANLAGGYGWASKAHLDMGPAKDEHPPERLADVPLGAINVGGPIFRLSFALSL